MPTGEGSAAEPSAQEASAQEASAQEASAQEASAQEASALDARLARATVIALIAILALAAGLRLVDLERNPPSLFEDELAAAASAWSIATTGHDIEQTQLPFLASRLDLKPPIYGFATVPFQAVLGQTVLAVRLPAVLFGTLATALMFWLTRVMGRRRVEALVAAAVFAVLPWAVHLGRVGWEPASVLPFTIGGAALLIDGLWHGRPWRIVVAGSVLALAAYAYQPALLEHVLLAAVVTLASIPRLGRASIAALAGGAVAGLVLLVPFLVALANPLFTQRTVAISVFRDGLKPEAFTTAWQHYWAQWDPVFLFFQPTFQPRNGPGAGVLMPVLIPVLLFGLVRLVRRLDPPSVVTLGWLAVGPVAAAVTNDVVPHYLRGLFALPPIVLVAARALEPVGGRVVSLVASSERSERARGWVGAMGIVLLATVLLTTTFEPYLQRYPRESAGQWGLGTEPAIRLVRERVPADATLCIDTAVFSYWTYPHFIAWYLPDRLGPIVERIDGSPACAEPGAYLLARVETSVPPGLEEVGRIGPPESTFGAVLWRVPGAS